MEKSLIERTQQEIIKEFYNQLKTYTGGLNLSKPLIPRISYSYLENRTIIIGQETNTWYPIDGIQDDLYHVITYHPNELEKICLNESYDRFINNHVEKYGGKFWEFSRLLYKKEIISGNMVNNGLLSHCWLNLFITESISSKNKTSGRPTSNKNLADNIINLQGDIILRLFRILSPKRIIFLTGHTLDNYLFKTALKGLDVIKMPIDRNNVLNESELAKFIVSNENHFLHKTDIIRCYHPSYFLGRINSKRNKNLRNRLKTKAPNISNSKYYIETLITHLKQPLDN